MREVVSEPILGQIRLQWWRDALDEIYAGKKPRRHEVVEPLAEAVLGCGLDRALLDGMIAAREQDLAGEPPSSLAALETYLAATSSNLLQAQLAVLGAELAEAARLIGIAWGLVGLIRALPYHAAAKMLYIPAEIAQAVDLHEQDVYALRPSAALAAALEQLSAPQRRIWPKQRKQRRHVPRRAVPALLIARLASRYLQHLAAAGYDPYTPAVQLPDPLAAWRLSWGRVIGRY